MTASDDLSRLRDLLYSPPSHDAWDTLTAMLLEWEHDATSLEVAVDYAEQHLDRWPDAMRLIDRGFLPDRIPKRGPLSPLWPLARELRVRATSRYDDVWELLTGDDPRLDHLTGFQLRDNALAHDRLRALGRQPWTEALRRLDLTYTRLDDSGASALLTGHGFPHLDALDLSHNQLGELGAAALFGALERVGRAPLRRLALGHNPLGEGGLRPLLTSDHVRHLTRLDLSSVPIGPDNGEALRYGHLTQLQALVVQDCALTDVSLRAILANPHLGALTHLELDGNPLGPDGCAELGAVVAGRLPALTHVSLHSTHIDDDAARRLALAPWLPQLVYLAAGSNRFRASGLSALLTTRSLAQLHTLDVSGNHLGPPGARALVRAELPGLRALHIGGARIGDEGARALSEAPWLPQLTRLDLGIHTLSADGLIPLLDHPDLNPVVKRHLLDDAGRDMLKALASAYRVRFEPRYLNRVTDALYRAVTGD